MILAVTTPAPDDIDYALAIVLSIISVCVFAAASATVRFYVKVRQAVPAGKGLLVWHIVTIAASVSGTWLLLLLGQLDTMGILSSPRQLRLVGYGVCGILTVTAIMIIAISTRRRIAPPVTGDG